MSILISSHGRKPLLARLQQSLQAQTFADYEILIGETQHGRSLAVVRNELYRRARGRWVYFLDEDCVLPDPEFLARMSANLKSERAFGGGYIGRGLSIWQKSYNALVNYWLHLHARRGQALPVAGNFLMPRLGEEFGEDFPFSRAHSFGGEEVSLRLNLLTRGIGFDLREDFSVVHDGGKRAVDFFRGAWRHGQADHQPVRAGFALTHFFSNFRGGGVRATSLMLAYLSLVWMSRQLWPASQ
ncbi:MAG TPA: glycosyltransferase family A protein [Bdellovibrionales bacterium]|nr:glycosyltransferase family A protein [Bdellovibrionales bacterium]